MPPEKRTSCRHTTHPAGRAQVFSLTSLFPAPPGQAPERDKLRRFAGRSLRLSARHSIPPFEELCPAGAGVCRRTPPGRTPNHFSIFP
nr:MAG TPA: hypothetical protein [Caudoviricetes sp.]